MNATVVSVLLLLVSPAAPPVKVEVIVDAEEEEDFFGAKGEKPPTLSKEGAVRQRADQVFDELEANEAGVALSAKKADEKGGGQNNNTQVVNVVVHGHKQGPVSSSAGAGASGEANAQAGSPAAAAPVHGAPAAVPSTAQAQKTLAAETKMEKSWWDAPSYFHEGTCGFFGQLGRDGQGFLYGLGAECFASDTIGIRFSLALDQFGPDSPRTEHNVFGPGGIVPQPAIQIVRVDEGLVHLTDVALNFHPFPRSPLSLYVGPGLSHAGYSIDYLRGQGGGIEVGGSGYLRLGAGLSWTHSRFFVGLDLGWYPIELFRYTVQPAASKEDRVEFDSLPDPFDPKRFNASLFVGLRI